MHVFTYGTLMFPPVWRAVVGREFATVGGEIRGFEIYRVKDALFPGIIVGNSDSRVRGLVYLDVDEAAVDQLDRFEDDFYVRLPMAVTCDDGIARAADAYVVPTAERGLLTDEPWTGESFVTSGGLEEFVRRYAGFTRARGDGVE